MKQRSRTLRPGYFTNEVLAELDYPARILFAGLWTIADREGRLEDRPKRIKVYTLPYDDEDIGTLLGELEKGEFIQRYSVDGSNYIQITNFQEHQNIHSHEADSVIPEPPIHVDTSRGKSMDGKRNPRGVVGRGRGKPLNTESEIYARIINDLNERAGTNFRSTTKPTQRMISGRVAEGATFEDFVYVHKVKCAEWLKTDMDIYLRPKTLYAASNFENYRQQKPGKQEGDPKLRWYCRECKAETRHRWEAGGSQKCRECGAVTESGDRE